MVRPNTSFTLYVCDLPFTISESRQTFYVGMHMALTRNIIILLYNYVIQVS